MQIMKGMKIKINTQYMDGFTRSLTRGFIDSGIKVPRTQRSWPKQLGIETEFQFDEEKFYRAFAKT